MEEYNLESAISAGEGEKTASDNGEIAKSKSEQGLLDLAAEEAWVRSWTQEKDAATDGQHQDGGGGGDGGKPEEEQVPHGRRRPTEDPGDAPFCRQPAGTRRCCPGGTAGPQQRAPD
eukprot:CAMPEP_0194717502 /NCGR_PEP_ID=MMETSP0296-20130528/9145_1 /TAXON_ID=39354 /ORGANISM="Heterosigma akashiwo, Strain CCMP2393" /LENGTH=116 /DNA_ID=CAMNT_0039618393 /DNA_START=323 /DNA_END=670 /DNA_ORIENTATION=-